MTNYKKKMLMLLSRKMDEALASMPWELLTSRSVLADEIQNLQVLIRYVDQMPTWPFNQNNIKRFYSFVVGGILPALISLALDVVKSYLFAR